MTPLAALAVAASTAAAVVSSAPATVAVSTPVAAVEVSTPAVAVSTPVVAVATPTVAASPSAPLAVGLDLGRVQVYGSGSYAGTETYADATRGSWSLGGRYDEYEIGKATATYRRISGRAAWSRDGTAYALEGGVVPRAQAYRARWFGADADWSWPLNAPTGARPRAVSLGASARRTGHSTDQPTTKAGVISTQDLGETDLTARGGVSGLGLSLAASVRRSVYNRQGSTLAQTPAKMLPLAGFDAYATGLPQDEWSWSLRAPEVRWGLTPSVAWTRTVYKGGQAPTTAAQFELDARWRRLRARLFEGLLSGARATQKSFFGFGAELDL